ncbi:MAG: terpene cyclase/mutase family protein [Planctomycetes bacterium]|nr:terpene cyclase/mutase family protein [Planctomycetota bacterium]
MQKLTYTLVGLLLLLAGVQPSIVVADEPVTPAEKKKEEEKPKLAKTFQARIDARDTLKHKPRIKAALVWLRDHQNKDGYWSATGFGTDSKRKKAAKTYNVEFVNVGESDGDTGWEGGTDVGLTGLALLAFAGAGYTHKSGVYEYTLKRTVKYLLKQIDEDGCFGGREHDHFVYNHAICTTALAEIYGLTLDAELKPVVKKAAEFILEAQNPGLGWRYGVKPEQNDTSVTGWMVSALHSCELAGIPIAKKKAYDGAEAWLKEVSTDDGYFYVGYKSSHRSSRLRDSTYFCNFPTMESIYVNSVHIMGKSKAKKYKKYIKEISKSLVEKTFLPAWKKTEIDFYYWYFGSLAQFKVGGKNWRRWEKKMAAVLLENQRGFSELDKKAKHTTAQALDEHGSWDSVGAWGAAGGRVYSTALNCLTLCVYTRYQGKGK